MQKDDDFLDNANLKSLSGPKISAHWILWGSLAFVLIALIWAKLAILDEVTTGEGKVIPSSKVQVIQNLEGGIIEKILVKEGQVVQKGQLLVIIDDTRFSASFEENKHKAKTLEARIERLKAETLGLPFVPSKHLLTKFPRITNSEINLYKSRQNELKLKLQTLGKQREQRQHELAEANSRKKSLASSFQLVSKELEMTRPLLKEGAASEVEILRLERQVSELKGSLEATVISIPRVQAGIDEISTKISSVKAAQRTAAIDELSKADAELAGLKKSIGALEDRVKRTEVKSPVRGTVKQIHVATIGGVMQPGSDLMEIVPLDDSLLIEARIRPGDIGFLHPGQKATVKITAYDFSIYGGLPGVVEHISADTIKNEKDESFYKIYVRTTKTSLGPKNKKLTIIPGMLASVDILTGEKSVLDYLLKPIMKAKNEALRER